LGFDRVFLLTYCQTVIDGIVIARDTFNQLALAIFSFTVTQNFNIAKNQSFMLG
jgi:hypothetical protein